MADAYTHGWLDAADFIARPYGADVFTPLSDEETKAAVAAMNEAVPHASERMHAAWARHWADVLREGASLLQERHDRMSAALQTIYRLATSSTGVPGNITEQIAMLVRDALEVDRNAA